MSRNGLTIRSNTIDATLLISLSCGLFLVIIEPLPSSKTSVQRIDRRAAPSIRFSPACVFSNAILK